MARPDQTNRFKVTEREAGTGRVPLAVPQVIDVPEVVPTPEEASAPSLSGNVPLASDPSRSGAHAAVTASTPYVPAAPAASVAPAISAASAAPVEDAAPVVVPGPHGRPTNVVLGERVVPDATHTAAHAKPDAASDSEAIRGMCGNDQVMPLVEAVRTHPAYVAAYERIVAAEADREFCLHQIGHQMDVARIAYIRVLERRMSFRKEVVYAAALLHDIGKADQYEHGEPHELASARIATEILNDIDGFSALEKTAIVAAVMQHRHYAENSSPLGKLLFEADKASRPCFSCPSREGCSWPEEKKNAGVKV